MRLYHGTLDTYLGVILREGLLPRSASGEQTQWPENPSLPEYVYLSECLDWRYAYATWGRTEGECLPMLVEVDVETTHLHPDEDWVRWRMADAAVIEQGWGSITADSPQEEKDRIIEFSRQVSQTMTPEMVPERKTDWPLSLRESGVVAHEGGIHPDRISRIVILSGAETLEDMGQLHLHLGGMGGMGYYHEGWYGFTCRTMHDYYWGRLLQTELLPVGGTPEGEITAAHEFGPLAEGSRRVLTFEGGQIVDDPAV